MLSLEAVKPARYLSFLLGAATIKLLGKVACFFSLLVHKLHFLFGFILFWFCFDVKGFLNPLLGGTTQKELELFILPTVSEVSVWGHRLR